MTYGIPHTVRGWDPTDIVTTVDIPPADQVDRYTGVVRGTVPGPVILVPTVALTKVDTTPAEPEPGAWDLDGVLCVRFRGDDSERHWASAHLGVVGGFQWVDWPTLWGRLGGPGITPRRLVPEPELPEVALPWKHVDSVGDTFELDVDSDGAFVVARDRNGSNTNVMYLPADRLAAAAARAAREVKP